MGNIYVQGIFARPSEAWGYASIVTLTAPTGDKDAGLTTGRVTADWTNYVEYHAGRLTPFGSAGIANAVSDTMIFVRPYTSLGFTSHFNGGARFRAARRLEMSGSAYAIVPSGTQTVYSRVVTPARRPDLPAVAASRSRRGVFEDDSVTTGSAVIARDHGFSSWVRLVASGTFQVYGGYTRSLRFGPDTVFLGVGLNFKRLLHQGGP